MTFTPTKSGTFKIGLLRRDSHGLTERMKEELMAYLTCPLTPERLDDMVADIDDDEATESNGHAEMNAPGDPDAPVMYISATEFGYDTATVEVEAGQPFSIQIHNEGMLEHDITFVGLESEFGLHVQPGEENIATWSIHEPGEYVYYCTVLGHRDAGMTGTLIVSAELVSDHDEADGRHDEADEAAHEDDHDDETAHGDMVQTDAPGA